MSKDKPCILKKRLNGVFDQNIGLIIQRFPIIVSEYNKPEAQNHTPQHCTFLTIRTHS